VVIVPRQNGKGAVDEAWALAQLFLNGCRIVLHTAHHAKTAKSAFLKMRAHIEGSPKLRSRLMDDRSGGIRVANGEWGFTFKTGQQLIYGTRTGGAGRGLTIDAIVMDEVQELQDDELDALKPTIVTAPNPQTLMTGSAPKDAAEVLPRLMARGRAGDPSLCYLEWSVDENIDADLDDRALWALANPGYGIRLFDEAIIDERGTMSDAGFARERLGIWSAPSAGGVFPVGVWESRFNPDAVIMDTPMSSTVE
jgi:phage terminase large subunit-like protein